MQVIYKVSYILVRMSKLLFVFQQLPIETSDS